MKKFSKGFVAGFLAASVLATGVPAIAQGIYKNIQAVENGVTLKVNGQKINQTNYLINNTTYVPLRVVSESLGQKVNWDGGTKTVYIGQGSTLSDFKMPDVISSLGDIEPILKIKHTFVYDKPKNETNYYMTDLEYESYKRIASQKLRVGFCMHILSDSVVSNNNEVSNSWSNGEGRQETYKVNFIYSGKTVLIFQDMGAGNDTQDLTLN